MSEQLSGELLYYPKLSLYAFHLCHDMALAEGERVEDADLLWQRFEEVGKSLKIPALESCRQWLKIPEHQATVPVRELLSEELDRCLSFHFPDVAGKLETPRRNGEFYAVQLHDTYVADLTFRYPGIVSVAELTHLNPEGMLLPDRISASIGQTLVLFAKPVIPEESPSTDDTLQDLADRCVQALLTSAQTPFSPSYRDQGKLLGSPIFEYDNDAENPAQSCHILIWLDYHSDTTRLEASTDYYRPLMDLLCYRSKIRFSYHQARTRYRDCRQLYTQLETLMEGLQTLPEDTAEKLAALQDSLLKINPQAFTYARYIRDIEDQRTTMITNLKNYTKKLEELRKITGEQELSFLEAFSDECRSKFLRQIHTDLNYLKPGQALFGHCIATMRGIVEVEEAQMNHNQQQANQDLQDHIQAVGVGIAAGAIVASTSGLIFQPWEWKGEKVEPSFPLPLLGFLMALLFSAFCSWGAWKWMKWRISIQRK